MRRIIVRSKDVKECVLCLEVNFKDDVDPNKIVEFLNKTQLPKDKQIELIDGNPSEETISKFKEQEQ